MKQRARRRTFLASLAAAPLLPAALLQVAPNPPSPSPAAPPSDEPGPMALALAEAARHRFGAHLRPGDQAEIAKAIHGNLQAAERLRKVPLGNADEPVTSFAARPPAPAKAAKPASAAGRTR